MSSILIVTLGVVLVIALSMVSRTVVNSEIPLFILEPEIPENNETEGSLTENNPTIIVYEESVQASVIKKLEQKLYVWFIILTGGFILFFLIGMLWISRLITEPITELTAVVSSEKSIDVKEMQTTPSNVELAMLQDAVLTKINQLEGLIARQNEFVMDTAHEFRSPVAAIRLNLDLVQQEKDNISSEINASLESIDRSTSRLEALLNQYRLYMCHEELFTPKIIKVNDIVKECINLLDGKALEKEVYLIIELTNDINLYTDPVFLQTLITNLIDNAIKYNRKGGIVRVSALGTAEGCELSIQDNGLGIPEIDLPYVFDRFYRVDKSRSRKTGGNGLGLSISKSIVEAAGGHIEIQSALDQGTSVRLFIPNYVKINK
ncbi:MAG: HAMP domain-containing histidine kinase [Chloroflexi bacterium]|nr:HAMP domain-containing histidine kinase [Chloroflexota bacterium]